MNKEKSTDLSKKKKTYVQNFIDWIIEQLENMVYNITNKLVVFNGEVKEFMIRTDKRLDAIEKTLQQLKNVDH